MNVNEIIASGLLESYVLGCTTAEETALVQGLCKQHPELLKEIETIEAALMNASAQAAPALEPGLKEKIAAQLQMHNAPSAPEAEAKVIAVNNNRIGLYKFGMAASLLLFVSSVAYTFFLHNKVNQLNGELAELNNARSIMAQDMQVQQASMKLAQEQLQIAADPKVKKIALNGMNSLTTKAAAILWNTDTKEVYFEGNALPAPDGKQYQLWAIVDGKPVDAGMITLSGDSVFQKMKTIPQAQAFAVTIEKPGGSPTPSLETMCLLGNV